MTLSDYLLLLAALGFGFGGTAWLVSRYDLRRVNFLNQRIPSVAGLAFVLGGEFFYGSQALASGWQHSLASVYFLVTLGFGGLGLLDDLKGDRSAGGFQGHFQLLRSGKVTTGAVKAIGGGLLSLIAGYLVTAPGPLWTALVAALLIALSANTLNLLDLRPGRCLFGFGLGVLVFFAVLWGQHSLPSGILLWAAFAFAVILYPLDSGGVVMLGDTGANAFGAVLGVAGAIFFPSLWHHGPVLGVPVIVPVQALLVAFLIAFQFWCERHSLTKFIESQPLLRALDRKIGVRGEPNGPEIGS